MNTDALMRQIDIDDVVFIEGEQPSIDWRHDSPTNIAYFQPLPPKRVTSENRSVLPYWDAASYPPAEWLFTDGSLDFEGFIGLAMPTENATLAVTAIGENGSVLATCTQPLPQDGNFAWSTKLKLNIGDAQSSQLNIKTVLSADGKTIHESARSIQLVTPKRIEGRIAQLNAQLDAYNAKIAAIDGLPSPSKLRLAAILAKRFIGYVSSDIADKKLNRAWFTLDKVDAMLTDSAREADAIIAKVGEDLPLVLHGGSGIPDAMVQEAVRKGVSKINVNTELQLVFAAKTREYIEAGKDKEGKGFDPRKLLAPGTAACVDMVKYKIDVFGSTNKA